MPVMVWRSRFMIPCSRVSHCRSSLPCSMPSSFSSLAEQLGGPSGFCQRGSGMTRQHRRQRVAVEVIEGIAETGDLAELLERLVPVHIGDGFPPRDRAGSAASCRGCSAPADPCADRGRSGSWSASLPPLRRSSAARESREGSARLTPSTASVIKGSERLRHSLPRLAKASDARGPHRNIIRRSGGLLGDER